MSSTSFRFSQLLEKEPPSAFGTYLGFLSRASWKPVVGGASVTMRWVTYDCWPVVSSAGCVCSCSLTLFPAGFHGKPTACLNTSTSLCGSASGRRRTERHLCTPPHIDTMCSCVRAASPSNPTSQVFNDMVVRCRASLVSRLISCKCPSVPRGEHARQKQLSQSQVPSWVYGSQFVHQCLKLCFHLAVGCIAHT